jgi:hypothetical protein
VIQDSSNISWDTTIPLSKPDATKTKKKKKAAPCEEKEEPEPVPPAEDDDAWGSWGMSKSKKKKKAAIYEEEVEPEPEPPGRDDIVVMPLAEPRVEQSSVCPFQNKHILEGEEWQSCKKCRATIYQLSIQLLHEGSTVDEQRTAFNKF